jgi:hypothetical protein
MKFHPSVLAATVGFAGVRVVTSDASSVPACDAAVVQQAADEGFLEYVITNCMEGKTGPLNFLDKAVVGPSTCLAGWIADHQGSSPIPATGLCRAAYQDLVASLGGIQFTTFITAVNVAGEACSYASDELTVTIDCLKQTTVDAALVAFETASGYHIGGGQQCPAVTVRKLSQAGIFSKLVKEAVASTPNSIIVGGDVNPAVDGGTALCYSCYDKFHESIDASSVSDLQTLCGTTPTAAGCLAATPIVQAMADFKTCSGGFDIQFTGPVCSATDVDEVQKLIPAPYFTFTHCAYNPTESFCSTVDAYVEKIKEESDSSCVLCYSDYRSSVKDDALVDAKIAACTGTDGVYAAACKASSATSLSNFYACSGYQLNTVKPATAPIPVAGTNSTTTTTTTTLAPDAETSSMAPVDDTTKSATVAMTSGLALVAAAIVTVL